MDGLTAVREIRASEASGILTRNIVIALTGNARQGQIDQALAAGMDDGEWLVLGAMNRYGLTFETSCDKAIRLERPAEKDENGFGPTGGPRSSEVVVEQKYLFIIINYL